MKKQDLQQLFRELLQEELQEMYPMHPDDEREMSGDGYGNEYQRAFAHSQASQPRGQSQEKKAEELAKQGKFVVVTNDYEHCKSTDAVLGTCMNIQGVFDNYEDANKKAEELHKYADGVDIISSERFAAKNKEPEVPPQQSDDVPFEEGKKQKNPYKVGDKVTLRPDALKRHSQSVPAHAGFSTEQFQWRALLGELGDTVGVVVRLFPDSKHMNVKFGEGLIGIDFTEVLPAKDDSFDKSDVEQKPHPSDYAEGYGMGDMKKDPKKAFKGARWTVKYNEQISLQEMTQMIRDLIREETAQLQNKPNTSVPNETVAAMRDWVKECLPWRDIETEEEVDELPIDQLVKGINAKYDGGFSAFLRDSVPQQKIRENSGGWNPKPLPQDANQIAGLIHGLKEGTGIFFSYDKETGHQFDWIHISCVVYGDEYTYRIESNGGTEKKELDSEESIVEIAQEIATGGYHFYSIEPIQGYKKSTYRQDDPTGQDDDVDYPPDRQEPQYEAARALYEAKGSTAKEKVKAIMRQVILERRNKK